MKGDGGYSLLELLVVLAITSLVIGVAGARVGTAVEAARFRQVAEGTLSDLQLLRARAWLDGERIDVIGADGNTVFDLPDGVTASGTPLTISPTGTCPDAQLTIASEDGRTARYQILAPDCRPQRL